jgi:hypothetical protein
VRDAEQRALWAVEKDWKRQGRGAVALEVNEVRILQERFRARSGSGGTFTRDPMRMASNPSLEPDAVCGR